MKLQEAIDIISAGECHFLEFVKCDVPRGSAGGIRIVKDPRVSGSSHDEKTHRTMTVREGNSNVTFHTGLLMRVNGVFIE